MNISPDALRKELVGLLKEIENQITEVKLAAHEKGILAEELRDTAGGWTMIPLLAAKAQVYSALITLNAKR